MVVEGGRRMRRGQSWLININCLIRGLYQQHHKLNQLQIESCVDGIGQKACFGTKHWHATAQAHGGINTYEHVNAGLCYTYALLQTQPPPLLNPQKIAVPSATTITFEPPKNSTPILIGTSLFS